jgi:hypothetical protein
MVYVHAIADTHHSRSLHCIFSGEQCLGFGPFHSLV